ncbi:carboxylic ester hydrolase [Streptomyces fumigatiscleroticus]|nr:carboxylic ester hydrolase [Streptomyces fumigatiscleroticus]
MSATVAVLPGAVAVRPIETERQAAPDRPGTPHAPPWTPYERLFMSPHVTVTTTRGPVLGEWRDTTARFLGIPYAQAPVGALRFAAPVPPRPWTAPLPALEYGPTAQRRPLFDVVPTTIPEPSVPGDAVLNLDVFTPDPAPGAGLPVLVWIHGGGYRAGSAASPWYDGASFTRDGVVLVSVGYRLGIEGFLHLDDAPDNRGVRDWIAALEWVRENIAAFGGDPDKVTVAGQSAGGGAVQTLLATPSAHGLFRAAISMSGAVMRPQRRRDALAVSERFTRRTQVPATAAALRDLSGDELDGLADVLLAPGPDGGAPDGLVLAPFADGELVPEPVPDAFADGTAAPVPLLLGFTRDEFSAVAPDGVPPEAARAVLAGSGLGPRSVTAYLALHEGLEAGPLLGQALTDATFRGPSLAIAEARAGRSLPTWLYHFVWASTASSPRYRGMAGHCLDIPFAFDLLGAQGVTDVCGDRPPQELADAVHAAWVGFVRDLDPGDNWPRYTAGRRATLVWDTSSRIADDPLRSLREIWAADGRDAG